MKRIARLTWPLTLIVAAMLPPTCGLAQDAAATPAVDQVATSNGEGLPELTLTDVEAALAAVEADAGIEDTVKSLLRSKYEQAIAALKESAANSVKATKYLESMSQAPEATAKLRAQLQELPSVESVADVTAADNDDDAQQTLNGKRAALAALNEQLSAVTAKISDGEQRPAEISVRVPDAQRELSEVRTRLASEDLAEDVTSAGRVADRFLLQAQAAKLLSELEMLKQEQLSMSVRRNLYQAQMAQLSRQVENASASVAAYEALVNKSVTKQAQDIGARAAKLEAEVSENSPALTLATEVQKRAKELESILQNKKAILAAKANVSTRLERLTRQHEGISKQFELGQPGREMAEVLMELRALLDSREREPSQERQWPTLSQTRLAAVQVDAEIERQEEVRAQFAGQSSSAVENLVAARGEVLDKLRDQYLELIPVLASLESETKLYFDKAEQVRTDIGKQLFWIRISPPLNADTLRESPGGLRWALSFKHAQESWLALWATVSRAPSSSATVILIAGALLLLRPRISAALKRAGEGVGRVSTDRYGLTGRATLWTVLLSLPIPLLAGFVALSLSRTDAPSDWMRGVSLGLRSMLWVVGAACTVAACCYPGGLGAVHFGWPTEPLNWLRRAGRWFSVVYVPLMLLACCTLFGRAADYLDSIGRVSFILAHVWLAIFLGRLFYSPNGIHASLARESAIARFRHLGSTVAIACPIGLVLLAWVGYTIAALNLSYRLVLTLIILAGGVVLYGFALRWFKIEHRKLALAEALERRRTRQVAAASKEQQEESDEVIYVDQYEQELGIHAIDGQTRHLVRLLFGLAIATAVVSLWSATLPLIEYLEETKIPMTAGLTLLEVTNAALVAGVTWIAMKNLPGVLEFAVLRATSINAGTRHAIATICQYAVIATGLSIVFNVLNLDWTQFGWIAGGLSVGIGFGLQEVVANFVCGLILLFERPIRVGDVVTIEGEIGTVTKIHMRATTITNFDRGEVVLPNKMLITSKLVNWTLSASLNRVVIPVGVAYGTDIEKARQILLDLAADHPNVLEDPAPVAIFDQFADSSLNIVLRAFLPDRSNRDGTISELHTEINKRFAAAGIEIPFPQRDFHLRSGWDSVRDEANEAKDSASWAK